MSILWRNLKTKTEIVYNISEIYHIYWAASKLNCISSCCILKQNRNNNESEMLRVNGSGSGIDIKPIALRERAIHWLGQWSCMQPQLKHTDCQHLLCTLPARQHDHIPCERCRHAGYKLNEMNFLQSAGDSAVVVCGGSWIKSQHTVDEYNGVVNGRCRCHRHRFTPEKLKRNSICVTPFLQLLCGCFASLRFTFCNSVYIVKTERHERQWETESERVSEWEIV